MKYFHFIYAILAAFGPCFAQKLPSDKRTDHVADSLYNSKEYASAAHYYLQAIAHQDFETKKRDMYYNAACCLALAGKADSAISMLRKAVDLNFTNKSHLARDPDLESLHGHDQWKGLLAEIKDVRSLNADPGQAKFITEDIGRFWNAYDSAYADTTHFRDIFKRIYFDQATEGMKDYMGMKVSSIDFFVRHIRSAPAFYHSIRPSTLAINDYADDFLLSFKTFKDLYPDARFPDVYFVIGALTSGGTVSDAGLLIGLNQTSQPKDAVVHELDEKKRLMLNESRYLPNLIAHELIHFQQQGLKKDTTTLSAAIREGMADFLGELISGGTPNPRLYEWATGKEKSIWGKFKQDIYYNRSSNWVANNARSTPESFPDQGYWVGYQICKSYYEQADDKRRAITDMLHIQDYRQFLDQSGWEEKIGK